MYIRIMVLGMFLIAVFAPPTGCENSDSVADIYEWIQIFKELLGNRKFTETPGIDLEKMNRAYTGWTSPAPNGADTRSNSHITIWVKFNNYSEEILEDGKFSRSDKAYPLIQYGYKKHENTVSASGTLTYSVNDAAGVITVRYHVNYVYRVWECDFFGCGWVYYDGSLSIERTYPIHPIHYTCTMKGNLTMYKVSMSSVIPTGDNPAFKYRYELYLWRGITKDYPHIEAKYAAYEILKGSRSYYAVPMWLDPPAFKGYDIHPTSNLDDIPDCSSGALMTDRSAGYINMTYWDAFGYPHKIKRATVETIPYRESPLAFILAVIVIVLFMLYIIKRR